MRVLIADDDATSRQLLASIMERWDYTPILAEDGLQALELMQQEDAPSLLMLDWEMPGLDGISLAQQLTSGEKTSKPPYIIMLTARDKNLDVINGLDAGANDYITKPYETGILKARVAVAKRTIELQDKLSTALQALEELANFDELTRLPNRRSIMNSIEAELSRAQRQSTPLSIGICDIDFFKQVNDNFGHHVGDAALQQTAEILRQSFRPYDVLGRYGGEEFIFAITADNPIASNILERLRVAVERHAFKFEQQQTSLTLSAGVVMVDPSEGDELSDWIKKADEALYQAKRTGRNRVCFYQPSPDAA